ncbi:hypothetical protein Bbelb_235880 [Branchiostoma belcheri]|nr:hypothetical protein Bbelb_235880 [Branchiostoma belcheri]
MAFEYGVERGLCISDSVVPEASCRHCLKFSNDNAPSVFGDTSASQTPSYRKRPAATAVRKGETVTLHCAFHRLGNKPVMLGNKPVMWLGPPNFQVRSYACTCTGRKVTLHCAFHRLGNKPVMWLGPPNFQPTLDCRDASSGEFNLRIRDVRPGDEGDYRCTVFSVPPAKDARITVIVPPPSPPTIMGETVELRAGKGLVLTCRSVGGRPLPRLSWYNGTRKFVIPAADEEQGNAPGEVSLTLLVRFLSKWDNRANLTCRSDQGYPDVVRPQQTSAILNRKGHRWREEGRAFLQKKSSVCVTHAPEGDSRCRPICNTDIVSREPSGFGALDLHGPALKAPAKAASKFKENSPTVKADQTSVTVTEGQPANLTCHAEGNPRPVVRWKKLAGGMPQNRLERTGLQSALMMKERQKHMEWSRWGVGA